MPSKCAACGKGGDNLKVCTSCEQVSYCNAKCRNSHRSKHKKACRQYTAIIRDKNAVRAEIDAISEKLCSIVISDEELFADPPPKEECPICLLLMPHASSVFGVEKTSQSCCGKTLCCACWLASMNEVGKGNLKDWCAFCRDAAPTSTAEMLKMMKTGKSSGDAKAISDLGYQYRDGAMGLPKDRVKALKLWLEAVSIKPGLIETHFSIAEAYLFGRGAEKDIEKVIHHWKLAAIGGHERARYNLGLAELRNGNVDIARHFEISARAGDGYHRRAMKHFVIAARAGYNDALKGVKEG